MSLTTIYKNNLVSENIKNNIQSGKKSDLFSYFLRGNTNLYNLSEEQLGNVYQNLKKHVFHLQEFIHGK